MSEPLPEVTIYTDGGADPNPGTGGWAAVLIDAASGKAREISGGEPHATNNRMELTAAIRALEALKRSSRVDIHTDSEYVQKGISTWIHGWKRRGWRNSLKEPVKNADLWQRLDAAQARHDVRWHWVRGHAGHTENERADELAREGMQPFLKRRR
jgi:ribonuclease HI